MEDPSRSGTRRRAKPRPEPGSRPCWLWGPGHAAGPRPKGGCPLSRSFISMTLDGNSITCRALSYNAASSSPGTDSRHNAAETGSDRLPREQNALIRLPAVKRRRRMPRPEYTMPRAETHCTTVELEAKITVSAMIAPLTARRCRARPLPPGERERNAELVSGGGRVALAPDRSGCTHRRVSTPVMGRVPFLPF